MPMVLTIIFLVAVQVDKLPSPELVCRQSTENAVHGVPVFRSNIRGCSISPPVNVVVLASITT